MYFITTIDSKDNDIRCVGYFKTFKEAEEIVLNNAYDIWETCYNYVVIENIPEGIYQYDFNPIWYKWRKLVGGYIKCEPPKLKDGFNVGYAMG